jgi:hypothetical protein
MTQHGGVSLWPSERRLTAANGEVLRWPSYAVIRDAEELGQVYRTGKSWHFDTASGGHGEVSSRRKAVEAVVELADRRRP